MIDAILKDGLGPYVKRDPRSILPISVDWTQWLAREGTTISASAWEVDAGITLSAPTFTTTAASVRVAGGVAGTTYTLRNTITCASGIVDSRSIRVVVTDR